MNPEMRKEMGTNPSPRAVLYSGGWSQSPLREESVFFCELCRLFSVASSTFFGRLVLSVVSIYFFILALVDSESKPFFPEIIYSLYHIKDTLNLSKFRY
jgi:hypothetical protein